MWHSVGAGTRLKSRQEPPMDAKTIIIGLLAVAVIVLGSFYYENSRHGISIDTPAVKIEAK